MKGVYYMISIVLEVGDFVVNKIDINFDFIEFIFLVEEGRGVK